MLRNFKILFTKLWLSVFRQPNHRSCVIIVFSVTVSLSIVASWMAAYSRAVSQLINWRGSLVKRLGATLEISAKAFRRHVCLSLLCHKPAVKGSITVSTSHCAVTGHATMECCWYKAKCRRRSSPTRERTLLRSVPWQPLPSSVDHNQHPTAAARSTLLKNPPSPLCLPIPR